MGDLVEQLGGSELGVLVALTVGSFVLKGIVRLVLTVIFLALSVIVALFVFGIVGG